MDYLGNTELIKLQKTAFFAPGKISPSSVLPCYDWANEMVRQGQCVISGFKSKLERDVWNFLIKGSQPIILVQSRKRHSSVRKELEDLIKSGRLLIVYLDKCDERSPYASKHRNEYIATIADKIIFASINKDSSLFPIYEKYKSKSAIIAEIMHSQTEPAGGNKMQIFP